MTNYRNTKQSSSSQELSWRSVGREIDMATKEQNCYGETVS